MIISWANLLIIVIALAAGAVAIGSVVSFTGKRRSLGLSPGTRDAGSLLAWSHAPRASALGGWYLSLAGSVESDTKHRSLSYAAGHPFVGSFTVQYAGRS